MTPRGTKNASRAVLIPTRDLEPCPWGSTRNASRRARGACADGCARLPRLCHATGGAGDNQRWGISRCGRSFSSIFPVFPADGYLADAVRGFFANGGEECYVLPLQGDDPLYGPDGRGWSAWQSLDRIDLVCAPDIMRGEARASPWHGPSPGPGQCSKRLWEHCEACGDRLVLLDAWPDPRPGTTEEGGAATARDLAWLRPEHGANAASYYPWLEVPSPEGPARGGMCPHADTWRASMPGVTALVGVTKAPANAVG